MLNLTGLLISLVALGLFFPGILLPMFALNMDMAATVAGSSLTTQLVAQELSILSTVEKLWADQRHLVAALIFFFSVVIPLTKSSLVALACALAKRKVSQKLLSFVTVIGKWSMADVFVVAVFLAVLSTNHADTSSSQSVSVFGMNIGIDISTQTLSAVGDGFYYFVGYCVLSLLGSQLVFKANNAKQRVSLTD